MEAADEDAVSTKRPSDEGAVSLNVTDVLMIHIRLKIIQERAGEANKTALEAEKETRDDLVTTHQKNIPLLNMIPHHVYMIIFNT